MPIGTVQDFEAQNNGDNMAKAVFGIAQTESQAIAIADQLKAAGFSDRDVSVLFPDKKGTQDFAHEQNTKAPEGAATGAAGGALLGGP